MRRIFFYLLAAVAVVAAPASAQQSAKAPASRRNVAADTVKVGTYDLEITTDDGTMIGALIVRRDNNRLVAEIHAGGRTPAVKSFVREGSKYVLTGGHNDFTVTYTFTFVRDSVSGSFAMSGGLEGTLVGAYRR